MAWSPTYTTVDIVKNRLLTYSSSITDAMIEEYIRAAEGVVEATIQTRAHISGATLAFDQDRHKILRQVTTDIAAFYLISFDPSTFLQREKVALQADMFWDSAMRGLALLANRDTVEFLQTAEADTG